MSDLVQNAESQQLSDALEKLGEEAVRLQSVIDTVPSFLWTSLPDGSKEYLNKRWYEYTGLPLEQGKGWGWKVVVHPDDLDRLVREWQALLDAPKPGELETRIRDMTESTVGSSYVSFHSSTLKATSSGGLEATLTSKIEKGRRRNSLRRSGSFAGLPMLYRKPLLSWTRMASRSTRTRQCSTIPASPCKMYLSRTFAPESTIRKISRGCARSAKQA